MTFESGKLAKGATMGVRLVSILMFLGVTLTTVGQQKPANDDAALRARAEKLHREAIVLDTHNDITSPMLDDRFDIGSRGDDPNAKIRTHTDIARMKSGGLDAVFFSIYVGRDFVDKRPAQGGGAARRALDMIGSVYNQLDRHPESLGLARTVADVRRISARGKIACLMGIEGGHAIEDSLYALRMFYEMGIRYMTLTHVNTNDWADSEADLADTGVKHHNGLTDFGRGVVREMNRLGMMVDISHVSDKTFSDVIAVTKSPVIASHSSARALANHTRNMSDEMLKALAGNGGVIMINFYDGFLDSKKTALAIQMRTKERELAQQYPNDPKRVSDEVDKLRKSVKFERTPLSVLLDHFDHVVKVAGINHVGIGSDFDGVPFDGLPAGMEDVSKLPNLTYELLKRGYSDSDVKKVLGENLLRVMAENEKVAREFRQAR